MVSTGTGYPEPPVRSGIEGRVTIDEDEGEATLDEEANKEAADEETAEEDAMDEEKGMKTAGGDGRIALEKDGTTADDDGDAAADEDEAGTVSCTGKD